MASPPLFTGIPVTADLRWWDASRPLFYAYQTTAQVAVPSNTWTAVNLQQTLIDRDGGHTGTSGRYTLGLTAGWYLVSGVVAFAAAGGSTRGAKLVLNGTDVAGAVIEIPATTSVTVVIPPTPVLASVSTDWVELQAWHDTGAVADLAVSGGLCSQLTITYEGSA